jgi:hypothetical protein
MRDQGSRKDGQTLRDESQICLARHTSELAFDGTLSLILDPCVHLTGPLEPDHLRYNSRTHSPPETETGLRSHSVSHSKISQAPPIPLWTGPDLRAASGNRTPDLLITRRPDTAYYGVYQRQQLQFSHL